MRRLWWVVALAVLVVLAQAAAVTYYFTQVPPRLAEDYAERAEPQQERVDRAIFPVAGTFDDVTFGTLDIDDDASPREFLRKFRRIARQDERELARADRQVRRAKRLLARVDEEAMTDPPSWPLLGGNDELERAADVAEGLDAYLRKARAFVRDYDRLLDYWRTVNRVGERVAVAVVEAQADIPRYIASAEQFTGPMGRAIRVTTAQLKRLRRMKPPAPVKADHRSLMAQQRSDLAGMRAMSAAIRRDDFNTANRIRLKLRRSAQRADRRSRAELQRFISKSRYRRQIEDLRRREIRLDDALDEL